MSRTDRFRARTLIVTGGGQAGQVYRIPPIAGTPEQHPPGVHFSNPPTLAKPPGYTHVVQVSGGHRTIYIAGQVGTDMERKVVGEPGDFEAQAEQAFRNLQSALESANARFDQVVKITMYFTDIVAQLPLAAKIRDRYVNVAAPPASTAVEVRRLARETLLFEIDAIAVAPTT